MAQITSPLITPLFNTPMKKILENLNNMNENLLDIINNDAKINELAKKYEQMYGVAITDVDIEHKYFQQFIKYVVRVFSNYLSDEQFLNLCSRTLIRKDDDVESFKERFLEELRHWYVQELYITKKDRQRINALIAQYLENPQQNYSIDSQKEEKCYSKIIEHGNGCASIIESTEGDSDYDENEYLKHKAKVGEALKEMEKDDVS